MNHFHPDVPQEILYDGAKPMLLVTETENFLWQDGVDGCDYSIKAEFYWISVIRLPDFVTKTDFYLAVATNALQFCARIITDGRGIDFDPDIVDAFMMDRKKVEDIYSNSITESPIL